MKAIALVSGGLDSILAARIMVEQAIEVSALHMRLPVHHYYFDQTREKTLERFGKWGIKVAELDYTEDFLEVLKNPGHGYGKNMNPCIDCRILMLKKTKEAMEKQGACFIVTGEVVGQRPMSQYRNTIQHIEKQAGVDGLVLRPLCAKLLPESIPEKNGWVKRGLLFNFSGRSRKPQIELAKKFGMDDYPNASGGCLLTYSGYAGKIKDLISHNELDAENLSLMQIGRHFRLSPKAKLIVGKDQKENQLLVSKAKENDFIFEPLEEIRGPTALGRGEFSQREARALAVSIVGHYCDKDQTDIKISMIDKTATQKQIFLYSSIQPINIEKFRIQ